MKISVIAVIAVLVLAGGSAWGAVYRVDDSGRAPFSTIQAAVDAASYGDTVLVDEGYYNERIIMKNGVVLIGAGASSTIIDGTAIDYSTVHMGGSFDAMTLVQGFRIQGGTGPGWSACGVWLGLECAAVVRYNVIIGNRQGVMVSYNNGNPLIDHNTIVLNEDCGVQVYVGNETVVKGVARLSNNIVVWNESYGVYRGSDWTTDLPPHPELHNNDVWDNQYADYGEVAP